MAISQIPYGQLENGNYGILVDDLTGKPLSSIIEVLPTLPVVADADNFDGRMVFEVNSQKLFVFRASFPDWFSLAGSKVTVDAFNGAPPLIPAPDSGDIGYDTVTGVLYIFDGVDWVAVGGRFGSRYIENKTISTGFPGPGGTQFALGTVAVHPEFVEVFLDGVRQTPNPGGDYNVIGSNVIFALPVAAGVEVFTRTVIDEPEIIPNTSCHTAIYDDSIASPGDTQFDVGVGGMDPNCVMVFRTDSTGKTTFLTPNVDYTYNAVSTEILNISRIGGTATVLTAEEHGGSPGDAIEIQGANELEYNGKFDIVSIVSPTEFTISVSPTAPTPASTATAIYFLPPLRSDFIVLNDPFAAGDTIHIKAFKNVVTLNLVPPAPLDGGVNLGSPAADKQEVYVDKLGTDLRFRRLKEGSGITLTSNVDSVTIASSFIPEVPVGAMMPFAGTVPPSGWLLCNGDEVDRFTFPDLFSVVGETYGAGDGVTTFNLPDTTGRVLAGKEDSATRLTVGVSGIDSTLLGFAGGDENTEQHTHAAGGMTTDAAGVHSHSGSVNLLYGPGGLPSPDVGLETGPIPSAGNPPLTINSAGSHSHTLSGTLADFGTGASGNVQPTLIVNYIIKHDYP